MKISHLKQDFENWFEAGERDTKEVFAWFESKLHSASPAAGTAAAVSVAQPSGTGAKV